MLVCTSLSNRAYTLADQGLQREVERGWLALANERSSLLPHLKNDKSVQAPFFRTQIDYLAFLREARNIYANAGPLTQAFYDSAETQSKSKNANCVIKWLLWQTLRQAEMLQFGNECPTWYGDDHWEAISTAGKINVES
jgi:hypothetical protein